MNEDNGTAVSVDMNVGPLATSAGKIVRMSDMARLKDRRKRYQRMIARRQRAQITLANGKQVKSHFKRRDRVKPLAAKTLYRIQQIRNNWMHRIRHALSGVYSHIFRKDLNIKI